MNRVEGNRLYPASMPEGLKPGVALYRSNDQAMERELSKQSAERKIPVTMSLSAVDEDGFCGFQLTMSDGRNSTTVRFPADHQLAKTPQRDNIIRELSKLGNTPYECTSVDIPAQFPYFIPASLLAAARRSLTPSPSRGGEGSIYTQGLKTIGEQAKELSTPLPPAGGAGGGAFGGEALMQCRYCLRYELGICLKHQGASRSLPLGDTRRGPLFLRLADGRRFRLEFDCRQCQMNVYADDAK